MIILEDKNRVPLAEEIDLLIEHFQAIQLGLEKSKDVYKKDIFGIEPLVKNIEEKMLPRKRIHQAGFPANTFLIALEDFARAVENLDTHNVHKYRPDIEFISSWLEKNPARSDILIAS